MDCESRFELIDRLSHDEQFAELTSNQSRAEYVLSKVQSFDHFVAQATDSVNQARNSTSKNLQISNCCIKEAELHLKAGNMDAALASIHKALLFSPTEESCELRKAKLYMDKAGIHFGEKNYLAALWSVEMAQEMLGSEVVSLEHSLFRMQCLAHLSRHQEVIGEIDQLVQAYAHKNLNSEHELAVQDLLEMKQKLLKDLTGYSGKLTLQNDVTSDDSQSNNWKKTQHGESRQTTVAPVELKEKLHFVHSLDARISIGRSPGTGRHMIATEDIAEHTVLLQERPFGVVMEPEFLGLKCSHCLHKLDHRFFPCVQCTEAVYCHQHCAQVAWTTYHKVECGIDSLFHSMILPSQLVFKMISQVGGPEKAVQIQTDMGHFDVEHYLEEIASRNGDETLDSVHERNMIRYKMASTLANHDSEHTDPKLNAQHIVAAIEVAALFEATTHFTKCCLESNFLPRLVSMLVVDIRRVVFNVFGWHEFDQDLDQQCPVANCQCLVSSLANHSCVPNITWDWKDGIIWFIANRQITAGEHITISYGPCQEMDYHRRQLRLNHYLFICACTACRTDASKGNCLRCSACSGPVTFNSAANENSHLNGRCLVCHQPCVRFDRRISELTRVKDSVTKLARLVMIKKNDSKLFTRAVYLLGLLADLSLVSSEPIIRNVFSCIRVLESCILTADVLHSNGERSLLDVALLVDRTLPAEIPVHLLDGACISSLRFWFESLYQWSMQLASTNPTISNEAELLRACTTLKTFGKRYQGALKSLLSDHHLTEADLIQRMVQWKILQVDQRIQQIKDLAS